MPKNLKVRRAFTISQENEDFLDERCAHYKKSQFVNALITEAREKAEAR